MHNYHTSIGAFPMGSTIAPQLNSPGLAQSIWSAWSAQAQMLGYMEQGPLYNACNFSWAVLDGSNFGTAAGASAAASSTLQGASTYNLTVLYTNIASFVCPSDPFVGGGNQNNNSYSGSYGATTSGLYNWTAGPGAPYVDGESGADSTGVFTIGKSYGIQTITDGTSNTVAFAEALVGDGKGSEFAGQNPPSRYRGNYITGTVTTAAGAEEVLNIFSIPPLIFTSLSQCVAAFQTSMTAIQDDRGFRWCIGTTGWTMFNTVQVPNDSKYPIGGCRDGGTPGQFPNNGFSYGASSNHPGGANVLFADGSCRFVKSTISYQTWWSLGTRNGGEVISSDSY
jgi:prepilin-type processing-associated H-X9-DG protein